MGEGLEEAHMLQLTVNEQAAHEITTHNGQLLLDGTPAEWDIRELPNGIISVLHNGQSYSAIVESIDIKNKSIAISINGMVHTITVKEPIDLLLSSMGLDMQSLHKAEPVKAPMPGMVLKILVQPGQQINKGDGLLILEAMKMENILKAGSSATVKAIKVSPNTAVEKGTVLIELE